VGFEGCSGTRRAAPLKSEAQKEAPESLKTQETRARLTGFEHAAAHCFVREMGFSEDLAVAAFF